MKKFYISLFTLTLCLSTSAIAKADDLKINLNTPQIFTPAWQAEKDLLASWQFKQLIDTAHDPFQLWDAKNDWNNNNRPGQPWTGPLPKDWFNFGGIDHCKICHTVTPEPVSTILFLAGGAPLALRLYGKRRLKKK